METRNSPYANTEDRISKLPDNLIHHILSFTHTKFAVQTCVLSRRWRYIWNSIPILYLSLLLSNDPTTGNVFKDFVDQVFLLHDFTDIPKIVFDVQKGCNLQSRLNTWIVAALKHNVQDLRLGFNLDHFQFSHRLFTCNLRELVLIKHGGRCTPMVLPGSIHLPHLKYLRIQSFSFDNEELTNELFSSCPLLEFLVLKFCKFPNLNVRISGPNLKHVEIFKAVEISVNGLHSDNGKVTLCTPNLSSFKTNDYMSTDYSLQNLSSLAIADISVTSVRKNEDAPPELELPVGVKELFAKRMIHFLRAVHNVKELRLSYLSLEFASGALEKLDSQLPQYHNLRYMKLRTSLSTDSLNAITYLLKITPNVESIDIHITQHYIARTKERLFHKPAVCPYFDQVNVADVESYCQTKLSLPSLLHSLKSVKIFGTQGLVNELMLLELFLKNSAALEQVVVESCTVRKSNSDLSKRRMKKFSEMLLKLPRAAATISILFNNYI
ncbi:hypothetical protein MKW92_018033 [Papaver armeniacum]|nr:hypothetical protein MKW92_018033 [Papaver armeniacum]